MTNFLIGFPDLQAKAVRTQTTNTFSDDTPLKNILGKRGLVSKLATATAGTKVIEFDSGSSDTSNYLYLARTDKLKLASVTTVTIKTGDTSYFAGGAGATTVSTITLASETLIGPRAVDLLKEYTETSAKRYTWLEFASGASTSTNDLDSLFIGKWFDFETEPGSWRIGKRYNSGSEMASSGTGDIKRKGDQRYTLNIIWNNISDSKAKEFMDEAREIYKRKRQFILRSTSPAAILDSKTILQVEFAELPKVEKTSPGYNVIYARFIEALG